MTDTLNLSAYKAACEARAHYRGHTPVDAYTIAGEDEAFIRAYNANQAEPPQDVVERVAAAMRVINEIEKKSKTYNGFWNDIAKAALSGAI